MSNLSVLPCPVQPLLTHKAAETHIRPKQAPNFLVHERKHLLLFTWLLLQPTAPQVKDKVNKQMIETKGHALLRSTSVIMLRGNTEESPLRWTEGTSASLTSESCFTRASLQMTTNKHIYAIMRQTVSCCPFSSSTGVHLRAVTQQACCVFPAVHRQRR